MTKRWTRSSRAPRSSMSIGSSRKTSRRPAAARQRTRTEGAAAQGSVAEIASALDENPAKSSIPIADPLKKHSRSRRGAARRAACEAAMHVYVPDLRAIVRIRAAHRPFMRSARSAQLLSEACRGPIDPQRNIDLRKCERGSGRTDETRLHREVERLPQGGTRSEFLAALCSRRRNGFSVRNRV